MTLVDTSVWVDHFRRGNTGLRRLLEDGEVTTHPMVVGELACGNLARRTETLRLLARLPGVPQVQDGIVVQAIESLGVFGKRLGWIDAHLLVASRVSSVPLWTLDRRLARFCSGSLRP